MDKIQEAKQSRILLTFHAVNVILVILNFSMNFLGLSVLKYVYLAQVIFTLIAVFVFDFDQIFIEILSLFFLEGQGRIIWEYQSWSRIIFDLIVFFSIFKLFIKNKRIIHKDQIPWPLFLFIILHFCWYFIELFNIYTASMLGVIGAAKLYIYPILFFFGVMNSNFRIGTKSFDQWYKFFLAILCAEIALSYYQLSVKQNHLLQISAYYSKPLKEGVFTGTFFRPFATTQLPGAISVFLFLTVGFLFFKKVSFKGYLFRIILMIASLFTILTCQVRSALIKYLLVIGFIQLGLMFYDRFKPRSIVPVFLILTTLLVGGKTFLTDKDSTGDENIDHARNRVTALADVDKMKSQRLTLDIFAQIAAQKLSDYPLGLGPGMTGAAASLNKEALVNNPIIKDDMLWAGDNLFISLFIDLGFGAFFYIILIFLIPLYFFKYLMSFYKQKEANYYTIMLTCFSIVLVILIGNWGALGLTYNPESFIFWLISGIGFKTIYEYRKKEIISAT